MELLVYSAAEHSEIPDAALDRDRLNHAAWGGSLTQEQYLERERRLWRDPFSRQGLRLWVLSDGHEPVASLETYAVQAKSGDLAGSGHGIASVYVEERHRGGGHASDLLRRVHERLRAEGALLTYLISEIGPSLYERLGYRGRPLRLRRLAASEPGRPDIEPGDPRVRLLEERDLLAVLESRYGRSEGQAKRLPLSIPLSPQQIGWHLQRGRIYAELLGRPVADAVGARAGDAFALWAPEYRHGVLRVLTLYPGARLFLAGLIDDPRSPEAAAVRDVLHAARDEAARLGLSTVEMWENTVNPGWLRGGLPVPAEDLPMLLPLRGGIHAEDWLDWERGHWL